ncbi:sodium channel protein Nach-like [Wyeomyia smithii]|uniref:sodium channel protein Nach-like n=1 Tax=Wyeomyia smithii TaxID=174621 RepID=UPI002467CED4|nr:sodium channel protein Nach-like [Wyeomyia smithii]
MMQLAWIRFKNTPTITTIETTSYPIWNIPFPAVTICNINKIDKSRVKNLTDQLMTKGLTLDEANQLLVSMSSLVNFESSFPSALEHEKLLGQLGENPASMLLKLNQPCDQLIKYCYWLGAEVPCSKYFQVTKTHVGFCCSFNADKSMYVGQKANSRNTGPVNIRLSGAGKHVGLSVTVDIQPGNYMAPIKSFYGAEVFVHNPQDFPADSDFEDTLQPGWDVDLCVTPLPISSSSSLRRVPLEQRQCFMENEGKLQSNSQFSLNLCMSECRLRTIIRLCKCVPFFYADFNITEAENVPLCTLQSVDCLRHFRKYFYSLRPPPGVSGQQEANMNLGMDCDCMPSCKFLNYNVQSIASKRKPGSLNSSYFGGRNVTNYATLHVHFKDLYCVKYRREAFMTWDSLLAAFGGILGLCMGGSVLSIVELLYYFTVKPFTLYQLGVQEKQLAETTKPPFYRRKHTACRMFNPPRYPIGYFERKNVIFREKMYEKVRKRITAFKQQQQTLQPALVIPVFEGNRHRNELGLEFVY